MKKDYRLKDFVSSFKKKVVYKIKTVESEHKRLMRNLKQHRKNSCLN